MVKESERQSLRKIIKRANQIEDISKVNHDEEKYYEVVDEYGITNELNNIIDGFNDHQPVKSAMFNKSELNIGIICDEFLFYSLQNAANLTYIPYSNQLEVDETIDMLLIVTSWRGLDHSWDYIANPKSSKRTKLISLINDYKQSDIPTVFYSKEDPVSYKEYLSLAKECDFIFTSAKEMVDTYIRDTGNKNVNYLEFGVNPLYHNPIGKDLSNDYLNNIVTFAGSWMVRFPERNKEALQMFSAVNRTEKKLAIVDRQYERRMSRYHYPSYLIKNISATIPHERLMRLHKATNWGINLNSVKDSVTMFANRVYELQAMGNVIISNYNKGVHIKFPHIFISSFQNDIQHFLKTVKKEEEKELIATGLRSVMLSHTSYHRIAKLIQTIDSTYKLNSPQVLIVGENEQSEKAFHNQSYENVDYINLTNFQEEKVINDYDFIAFFSAHINYKSNYIENLLSAFVYTDSDVVVMGHDFYDYVENRSIIKPLGMIKSEKLSLVGNRNHELAVFNIPLTQIGVYEASIDEQGNETDKLLTIVIPIEEDYRFLRYKSLLGLKETYLSDKINIILVDNGIRNVNDFPFMNELKEEYKNLSYYYVGDQGLELNQIKNQLMSEIKSGFITFVEPQNQLSVIGLKDSLHTLEAHPEMDLLIPTEESDENIEEEQKNHFINQINRLDGRLSGLIIRKSFLLKNNIEFNEEIKDDDMLFLIKVLKTASNIAFSQQKLHHDYSVSFELSESTFIAILKESLLREQLIRNQLDHKELVDYTNEVFINKFVVNYIEIFKKIENDKLKGLELIKEIYETFETYYDGKNEDLNDFVRLLF